MDIKITVIDREGKFHRLNAPTDMDMNLMDICKSYELPVEALAEEWQCVPLASVMFLSDHLLNEKSEDEGSYVIRGFSR